MYRSRCDYKLDDIFYVYISVASLASNKCFSSHIHWDSSVFQSIFWSGRPGLFLSYYISIGIIICKQFKHKYSRGRVEGNAFTTVYPYHFYHFPSLRLWLSTAQSIEFLYNYWFVSTPFVLAIFIAESDWLCALWTLLDVVLLLLVAKGPHNN